MVPPTAGCRLPPPPSPRATGYALVIPGRRLCIPGLSPFPRITTADVEISGTVIPKGSPVIVNYETALRDPRVFEDPERFDIRREQPSQPRPLKKSELPAWSGW